MGRYFKTGTDLVSGTWTVFNWDFVSNAIKIVNDGEVSIEVSYDGDIVHDELKLKEVSVCDKDHAKHIALKTVSGATSLGAYRIKVW